MSDVRARIDAAAMSPAQVRAVALTFLLSALDGYDVLSVTFAAPAITAAWGIGRAALGVVLSAGLAGMALGAFLLAPLADVTGRKRMILVALALMAAGMLACAFAGDLTELALWRVVTGLGIGACVAVINPIAAEFANARRRALTVSIMAIGYPVGGVVGGIVAAALLAHFGWPAVFVAGALASLALLPVIAIWLPETPSFLLTRRGPQSLDRLNAVLARLRQPLVEVLPDYTAPTRRGYAAIFAPGAIGRTLWVTGAGMLFTFCVYFVLSWLPQMVADAGFPPSTASLVSAIASTAGVVGGLLLGWVGQRRSLRGLVAAAMVGLGLSTAAFGIAPASMPVLVGAAAICGFFLFGGSAGLYAVLATTFADAERASGTGFVSGMGRVSSAIAPLVAGWLFGGGLGRAQVSLAFGACAVVAGTILFLGWRRFRPA